MISNKYALDDCQNNNTYIITMCVCTMYNNDEDQRKCLQRCLHQLSARVCVCVCVCKYI